MKETIFRLFVYGSLRSGFHHPAFQYISRYFRFEANGRIKGDLYDLGQFPAAVPCDEEHFIVGELYIVKDEAEFNYAIEQLDDYEGVIVEEDEGETPMYRRETSIVYLDNNETTHAWVYWFNDSIEGKPLIASGDVLEYFKQQNKL